MSLPQCQVKTKKNAVMLYTDWKRLYEHFGKDEGWNANITTIDGIISIFDCAINVDNKYRTRGFYITTEGETSPILIILPQRHV